jgi:hypothetical protein
MEESRENEHREQAAFYSYQPKMSIGVIPTTCSGILRWRFSGKLTTDQENLLRQLGIKIYFIAAT